MREEVDSREALAATDDVAAGEPAEATEDVADTDDVEARKGVSVCVVSFRGGDVVRRTLQAVDRTAADIDEVIFVDSGSSDGSEQLVAAHFPHVRIVSLAENRGPAAARNRAFAAARYDRLVFVDHDVVVGPECIARLLQALTEDEGAVVAVPRVLFAHRPGVVQFEGADAHYLGLMALRLVGAPASTGDGRPTPIGSMVSACFALDRGRWGAEPPFDESFGFNYEDHDFGVRCRTRGFRILAVPSASCLHGAGTPGLSARESSAYPRARVHHLVKGRWSILLKSLEVRTFILLAPALLVYEGFQMILLAKRRWLGEWIRALRGVTTELGDIRRKRARVQHTRMLPDRALLTGGALPIRTDFPSGRLERTGLSLLERFSAAYWSFVRRAL